VPASLVTAAAQPSAIESARNDASRCNVAVVIVHWQSSADLRRCLAALRNQSSSAGRIIVVDNGGLDPGVPIDFPEAEFVSLPKNVGFACATNLAARRVADYEWIALLNPDAVPQHDWLENLTAAAYSHPEYSSFASRQLNARDDRLLDGAGDEYHGSGLAWRSGAASLARGRFECERDVFSCCAAAALYRRSHFLEVGGFDESYFCYFEDVDLGFRLRLAGYRCLYVPQAVVRHVGSATTGTRSPFCIYYGHRNLVWTFWKNVPWQLLPVYLPQHLFWTLAALIWFTLRGQGRTLLCAKWDAWKQWRRILTARRQIQRSRRASLGAIYAVITSTSPLVAALRTRAFRIRPGT